LIFCGLLSASESEEEDDEDEDDEEETARLFRFLMRFLGPVLLGSRPISIL